MGINEIEEYYDELIEEKQLELIWHPDRREKCGIQFLAGEASRVVYSYPEDTPMSFFRELNMFYLFLSDLQMNNWKDDSWKLCAIKAISYLRMVPVEIQMNNLEAYHRAVSDLYEKTGNEHKARLHREQALMYATNTEEPLDAENIMNLLDEYKGYAKAQLDIYIYVHLGIYNS